MREWGTSGRLEDTLVFAHNAYSNTGDTIIGSWGDRIFYRRYLDLGNQDDTGAPKSFPTTLPTGAIARYCYGGFTFANGFVPYNFYNSELKKGTGMYYDGNRKAVQYMSDFAGTDAWACIEYYLPV